MSRVTVRPRKKIYGQAFGIEWLEDRTVPAPVVNVSPPSFLLVESGGVIFNNIGSPNISVDDPANGGNQLVEADITSLNGTISVDATSATAFNITVSNDNTNSVILTATPGTTDLKTFFSGLLPAFSFTPDPYFSGDASVSVLLKDSSAATATGSIALGVQPLAVAPTIGGTFTASGSTGTPIPLNLNTSTSEPDPQESIEYVELSGYTAGTTFNNGSEISPGTWRMTQSDLATLTVTVPVGSAGDQNITIFSQSIDTAIITGLGTVSSRSSATQSLTVSAMDPPTITASPATTTENTPFVYLGLSISDPQSTSFTFAPYQVTVSLTNASIAPADTAALSSLGIQVQQVSASNLMLLGTFDSLQNYLTTVGFNITPTAFFSGMISGTATLDAPEPATVSAAFSLNVTPVAFQPNLFVPSVSGGLSTSVPFPIQGVTTPDTDGSENVTIYVSNLPAGVTFNNGTMSTGGTGANWVLQTTDLPGLQIQLPANIGTFSLTVTATTLDSASAPTLLVDSKSSTMNVNVTVASIPPGIQPSITGPSLAQTFEDTPLLLAGTGPGNLSIGNPSSNPGDIYRLQLVSDSGTFVVPPNLGITLTPVANGVVLTGTFANISQALVNGLQFIPKAHYSGPGYITSEIIAPDNLSSSSTTNLIIPPVATPPTGYVPRAIYEAPGGYADLPVLFDPTPDTDGSEIQYAMIKVPSGFVLSVGVYDSANDIWKVDRSQLPGLQVIRTTGSFTDPPPMITVQLVNQDSADIPYYSPSHFSDTASLTFTTSYIYLVRNFTHIATPADEMINENGSVTYSAANGNGFYVDPASQSPTIQITLSDTFGTLHLLGTVPTVTVVGDGTNVIVLTGTPLDISNLLDLGLSYTADAYRSGEDTIEMTLNDTVFGNPYTYIDYSHVQINPIASPAQLTVDPAPVLSDGIHPYTVPVGKITLNPWPDLDVSEAAVLTFQIAGVTNPGIFIVNSINVPLMQGSVPGQWFAAPISSPTVLQNLLDSLYVAYAAPGFSGVVNLNVTLTLQDKAYFGSLSQNVMDSSMATGSFPIRFLVDQPQLAVAPVSSLEGTPIDLGNSAIFVADPDNLPGDNVRLKINSTAGNLIFNPNLPAALTILFSSPNMLVIDGDINALMSYLAMPGSILLFPPSPTYSGSVDLYMSFVNDLGNNQAIFSGDAIVHPVAQHIDPAASNAQTTPGSAVSLNISIPPFIDLDGSESVFFLLSGIPASSTLSAGTNLGGGVYQLTSAELLGLTLTPSATAAGVLLLQIQAFVTDQASLANSTIVLTDSYNSPIVPFTITVLQPPIGVTQMGGNVDEGSATGTIVGQLIVNGGFVGESFSYSIAGPIALDFQIDSQGVVKVGSQTPDFESLNSFDIPVTIVGSFGSTINTVFHVVIGNVNEPPAISGPPLISVALDTPQIITTLQFSDPDSGINDVQITLQVQNGLLDLLSSFGLVVTGQGTNSLVVSGPINAINAAFANGLEYTPNGGYSGSDTLTVIIDDLGSTGVGGAKSTQLDIAVSVATAPVVPPSPPTVPPPPATPLVPPTLNANDAEGDEGAAVPLFLTVTFPSPVIGDIQSIRIQGLPAYVVLSQGTLLDNGDWSLTADQLVGLTAISTEDTDSDVIDLVLVSEVTRPSTGETIESQENFSLKVLDVAPSLRNASRSLSGVQGQLVRLDLGQFSDPGKDEPWLVTISWGDGEFDELEVMTPGDLGLIDHIYMDSGKFEITLSVADDDTEAAVTVPVQILAAPSSSSATPLQQTIETQLVLETQQTLVGSREQVIGQIQQVTKERPPETPKTPEPQKYGGSPPVAAMNFDRLEMIISAFTIQTSSHPVSAAPGQPYGQSVIEARSFAVERERHPLPAVLPLDQSLPAASFGESSGDSISLIEKLYEQALNPSGSQSPQRQVDPESPDTPKEMSYISPEQDHPLHGEVIDLTLAPEEPVVPHAVWVGLACAGLALAAFAGSSPTSQPMARYTPITLTRDEDYL